MIRVAIIGAGAAGLCMGRYLAAHPDIFTTVIYEQTSRVGGTWVYTDQTDYDEHGLPIHSSMYKNLRTNLPKQVMAFPDFPFPDDLASYMTHSEVYQYLENYTDHFSLRNLILFNHQIENVTPKVQDNNKNLWEVTVLNLQSKEKITSCFDAVVICNGHYSEPKVPAIPGLEKFPGIVMHSHHYRHPGIFAGKKVVLVGAGASGVDISLDLCDEAQTVYLSHHGNSLTCQLPSNLEQHNDIKLLEADGTIVFQDGEKRQADAVMFCTGYLFSFPFLTDECGITVHNGRVTHLYKHLFNIKYPSMAFIGLTFRICPFPQFSLQAQLITAVLKQNSALPSTEEMLTDEENDFQSKMSQGIKHHYAHFLGPHQWDYNKGISELAQCDPINPVVQKLYEHTVHYRKNDIMNYKNKEFRVTSTTFESLN